MNEARFWLAANGLAFIAILVTFIRRYLKVDERFNTLRLAMIFFLVGIPLYVCFQEIWGESRPPYTHLARPFGSLLCLSGTCVSSFEGTHH